MKDEQRWICKNVYSDYYKRHTDANDICRHYELEQRRIEPSCQHCIWWREIKETPQ
jgi:hypothetical protein